MNVLNDDPDGDSRRSKENFMRLWNELPELSEPLGGDGKKPLRLFPVEVEKHPTLCLLDTCACIDYLVKSPLQDLVVPIAARAQPWDGFSTWTIRSRIRSGGKTELQKLRLALNEGHAQRLRPWYHYHLYVDSRTGHLVDGGIAGTKELVQYALTHPQERQAVTPPHNSRAWFYYVEFEEYDKAGFWMIRLGRSQTGMANILAAPDSQERLRLVR